MEYCPKAYPYASKNIAHIFASELDETKIKMMFEEKDQDNNGENSYLVNLHSGAKDLSPYNWLLNNKLGDYTLKDKKIKFFLCSKHENSGKIESHLWFYKGFCAYTNPVYCQMIDAGTIPLKNSIAKIVKYMEVHK